MNIDILDSMSLEQKRTHHGKRVAEGASNRELEAIELSIQVDIKKAVRQQAGAVHIATEKQEAENQAAHKRFMQSVAEFRSTNAELPALAAHCTRTLGAFVKSWKALSDRGVRSRQMLVGIVGPTDSPDATANFFHAMLNDLCLSGAPTLGVGADANANGIEKSVAYAVDSHGGEVDVYLKKIGVET